MHTSKEAVMAWILLQHSEVWVDTSKVWLVEEISQSDENEDEHGLLKINGSDISDEDEHGLLKINGSDIYYISASSCSDDYGQLLEALGLMGEREL